jgi:hypothetical protein
MADRCKISFLEDIEYDLAITNSGWPERIACYDTTFDWTAPISQGFASAHAIAYDDEHFPWNMLVGLSSGSVSKYTPIGSLGLLSSQIFGASRPDNVHQIIRHKNKYFAYGAGEYYGSVSSFDPSITPYVWNVLTLPLDLSRQIGYTGLAESSDGETLAIVGYKGTAERFLGFSYNAGQSWENIVQTGQYYRHLLFHKGFFWLCSPSTGLWIKVNQTGEIQGNYFGPSGLALNSVSSYAGGAITDGEDMVMMAHDTGVYFTNDDGLSWQKATFGTNAITTLHYSEKYGWLAGHSMQSSEDPILFRGIPPYTDAHWFPIYRREGYGGGSTNLLFYYDYRLS